MYLRVFLLYFIILLLHYVVSDQTVKKLLVTKRSDIDLQTCLDNFDIHKDKIIRTQDSKDMGAKYINEIDLGSREECSRLCCETENCDVFVYEDKNAGSCYLFQCGPPEDFKCKFTHHANYSSAILAINRHVPDLESQIKLTKHEQELEKLSFRKSETEVPVNKPEAESTTTTTTTSIKSKVQPTIATSLPVEVVKCSRYQFECRSTKECIAIYNACDGIPQCADGSDEAEELGCPESSTTQMAPHFQQNVAYDDVPLEQNRLVNPQVEKFKNPKSYQTNSQQIEQPQIQNFQKINSDMTRPDNRNGFAVPRQPSYNEPLEPIYAQNQPQMQGNWATHQMNQVAQQYQPYDDSNSHIFNHKENGLQVSEGQGNRYNKHKGAMQILHRALGYSSAGQIPYEQVPENQKYVNYINEIYRQHPQYQDKWLKNNQDNSFVPPINQNPRANWIQNQQQEKGTIDHEHEKMAHELKHSKELMDNAKPEKKIKIDKVEKHIEKESTQYAKASHYKSEVVELQDGTAQTPGGAVLSLTLGLIITCVMALLIGCRLRMVRRRIRRGGKSFAHDADYLVNGMYL